MYLFILESIGTPELLLIAVVALIVFGPRRLPEMAKKMAKTMAEFKNATNEFKSTWEKEAAFEAEIVTEKKITPLPDNQAAAESGGSQNEINPVIEPQIAAPQIKELSATDIAQNFKDQLPNEIDILPKDNPEKSTGDKRDWL